ncbi:MAG: hypothetical protein AB8G16_07945 [Gammaproteobacteria bacterium]
MMFITRLSPFQPALPNVALQPKRLLAITALTFVLSGCFESDDAVATVAVEVSEEQLHPLVRAEFQLLSQELPCDTPKMCGDVVELNCIPEVDGPTIYYDNTFGQVLAYCGGATDCSDPADVVRCGPCPPSSWTCHMESL